VQYHPLMSSITNYSSQCIIIPLCPVLQTTAANAVSSPYAKYYKLQQRAKYHLIRSSSKNYTASAVSSTMSSITNYISQCSIIPLCPVLQTTAPNAVSSPYAEYYKLQQRAKYQLIMSSSTNYRASAVSSPYVKY